MANLGELVQMITALSSVQARKRELDLNEQQLAQQASQFAQQGEEAKFVSALKLIAGSTQKTRQGLEGLINTLAPQHREAAMAFLQGQPTDPTVLHAQDIEAGHSAMTPQQLAMVQNESAVQNATGMNVGGLAASQLGGVLAGGAAQSVTPEQAAAYAERAATGRDPLTAAVQNQQIAGGLVPFIAKTTAGAAMTVPQSAQIGIQQGQLAVSRGQLNFNYAQLDQEERKMAAYYGLDKMLKTAEAQKYANGGAGGAGGLTGAQWIDGMRGMTNILNDINKNTSDAAGNIARKRVFNSINEALGNPLPAIPLEGPGSPGKVGFFQQFLSGAGLTGAGSPSPWPTMTPAFGGQP